MPYTFLLLCHDENKSELDSHFGAIARIIKESSTDWDESIIHDQVADAIKNGARTVDVIPVVARSVDPNFECVKIVLPGIGCVHSVVQDGPRFLVEGRLFTKKTVVPTSTKKKKSKKLQKPTTRRRVLAVKKKFKNLENIRGRGKHVA